MKNLKSVIGIIFFMISMHYLQAQNQSTTVAKDSSAIKEKRAKEKEDYEKWLKLDWPNLKQFRESNDKLGVPAANEKRVVFMGNSITIGWIRISPEFFTGKPYINRGISGQTTPQMLVRFRADVINLKPKVVVILAGTNDIAGNTGPSTIEMIKDNLASMADLARANGIKVVLCSILPAYDYPWKPGLKPYEKILVLNEWIKDFAATNGCVYLDYYSAMVDNRPGLKAEYSSDGIHPNKLGYSVMAPLAEAAIAQAFGKKQK